MAKSKNRHAKGPQQHGPGESKKRKMQQFQRVSISSHLGSGTESSQKKRKVADATSTAAHTNQQQQQQQQAWKNKKSTKNAHQQKLHQRPTIPYHKKDRILLIGEGDFSFARSLYEHHRCKNVFATCYDTEETLLSKYHGQAEENIRHFLNEPDDPVHRDDADMTKHADGSTAPTTIKQPTRKVLYSVDARKLGTITGGGKDIRKGIPLTRRRQNQAYHHRNGAQHQPERQRGGDEEGGPWDIISFNFPHVGGLSTDVNRQVRANQELLVAFFRACVPLLSKTGRKEDNPDNGYEDDNDYSFESELSESDSDSNEDDSRNRIRTITRQSGQIIVTIFEGEPYTLWNIKDLARHAGLVVVTSFRFPWKSYPGYSHARTLGIVQSKSNTTDEEGAEIKRGGWKGEDREARSFVFEVKPSEHTGQQRRGGQQTQQQKKNNHEGGGGKGNRKRGREDDSSDEE